MGRRGSDVQIVRSHRRPCDNSHLTNFGFLAFDRMKYFICVRSVTTYLRTAFFFALMWPFLAQSFAVRWLTLGVCMSAQSSMGMSRTLVTIVPAVVEVTAVDTATFGVEVFFMRG
jgi:hypothetical protein